MTHSQAGYVREQAAGCLHLGSPMYADLLGRLADDLDQGGPTVAVLGGHEHDAGPSALALRLMGSVHRLVLERRAGELAAYYPSVGGTWHTAGWSAFRRLLADQSDAVREWLDRPPQTNEVGRAAALAAGLLELGTRFPLPVRLAEIGSSGGLNLLADRFHYVDAHGSVGPHDSPVVLDPAWTGRPLPSRVLPTIVERWGSDPRPVEVGTTEGRLALTAYVWADQVSRLERLRGAFVLAERTPYVVRRESAADFVDGLALRPGHVTVLWHSVMWQYVPPPEQTRVTARLAELGRTASDDAPLVHLYAEPTRRRPGEEHRFWVWAQTWPGPGEPVVLGRMAAHGLPVVWE
jgi:hypothetical protein